VAMVLAVLRRSWAAGQVRGCSARAVIAQAWRSAAAREVAMARENEMGRPRFTVR
jgi:hypothetical protein